MTKVLRKIGNIFRGLATISNIEFKPLGLHNGSYLYLNRIAENPGIINDELAEITRTDRTTTAKTVKRLIDVGLVHKALDPSNKKVRRLFTTEEGKSLYQQLIKEENYSEIQALSGLSYAEQAELLRLLRIVEKNVAKDLLYVKNGKSRKYGI
ncbi:MarR family winged helix-turn-helix transcriptional regulator [Lactococcus garvieae]|uniref:MarR family winged helix-turn-helix transcriptional regulator n=1 Tax=Lactococcus garvieae TaxID=1363 RepID=UPI0018D9E9DA|nr:MarR family transcriptional regulator [Lactococcus garvieae]QPS71729.1 MarR family transcriptional regulator [Lactococcus garvieae]